MADPTDLPTHAREWRVRFQAPDGYYTFVDISSGTGLLMSRAAALVWGAQQCRQEPKRFASVAHVYSLDIGASNG